jgi:hypothetical protein
MNKITGILLMVFSIHAMSDEPSVRDECINGLKSYSLADTSRIDTCPAGSDSLKIDVLSVGGNYHTCWLPAVAKASGKKFSAKENDCEVIFEIIGNELTAEFKGACRSNCGARASFNNGVYIGKTINK